MHQLIGIPCNNCPLPFRTGVLELCCGRSCGLAMNMLRPSRGVLPDLRVITNLNREATLQVWSGDVDQGGCWVQLSGLGDIDTANGGRADSVGVPMHCLTGFNQLCR